MNYGKVFTRLPPYLHPPARKLEPISTELTDTFKTHHARTDESDSLENKGANFTPSQPEIMQTLFAAVPKKNDK